MGKQIIINSRVRIYKYQTKDIFKSSLDHILFPKSSLTLLSHSTSTLGVEAQKSYFIYALYSLFGDYGINVDITPSSLLSSYITIEGSLKPFRRDDTLGDLETLQAASFETATKFLHNFSRSKILEAARTSSSRTSLGKTVIL